MKDFIPKGYLGWIWTIGVLTLMVLVVYTIVTGTSPFEALGLDVRWTTIIFGAVIGVLLIAPMIFKKK
jgi:hypothetical protein